MSIPKYLKDQINKGNVVLFLGAGASMGAKHSKGNNVPTGQGLADKIATHFLGEEFTGRSLSYIAELAISESDLLSVQKFVYDEFVDFYPNKHHDLIKTFKWSAIATTNYDLIIEKVYDPVKKPYQTLVPFIKDKERVEDKLSVPNSLIYLKLHGCINYISDVDLPLILTPDHYSTYKTNRTRLFERLKDLSFEHPFVFVGFSFSDPNIRELLNHLNDFGDERPRSYMVGPNINNIESRLWEKKKVTSIKMDFEEFLRNLDAGTDRELRKLSFAANHDVSNPLFDKFISQKIKPTDSLLHFLDFDVTYLHPNITDEITAPQEFYKGYFQNWAPISNQYDITRSIQDPLLSEIFLIEDSERRTLQDFFVIKGAAGSGKTVLLKRLAWEAGIEYSKICLFLKPDGTLRYESLEELYSLTNERVFLFIDNPSDHKEEIRFVIKRANKSKLPISIISAERINIWNSECLELKEVVTEEYELKYLNNDEIDKLIDKLETHNSLGRLKDKSYEERVESFSKLYGRELLVVLYEATMGKPFEDIIFNEYNSIRNKDAQLMYLSICILHRLGAQTRAGLISRAHNITFTHFENELFKPLESIVFSQRNYRINDFVYLSRHPYIAEIVFERVLVDQSDRYNEYYRLIKCLDVGYESDRHSFYAMTNARKLMELFKDPDLIRSIYDLANMRDPDSPKLLQQEAIFEMHSGGGSLLEAERLLNIAYELSPNDSIIAHSLAELYLRKAEKEDRKLLRERDFNRAKVICRKIIKMGDGSHAYHTLIKINLKELVYNGEDEISTQTENLIKETEQIISNAKLSYPNHSFLLEVESRFNEFLLNTPKALNTLLRAFELNKRNTHIALRLVNFYLKQDNKTDAIKMLGEAIEANPNNKDLNYEYAVQLSKDNSPKWHDVKHFLRKSFTKGDSRYEAQFWYARCLFLLDEVGDAKSVFEVLKDVAVDIKLKKEPRGEIIEDLKTKVFRGTILRIEASYAFVRRDVHGDSIFIYRFNENQLFWDTIQINQRVRFNIAFNYRGPVALNIHQEIN